jgi:predicted DsbA family dithiol-disulfide isomerase
LRSFFAQGLDISDRDVLSELGEEAGLQTSEILTTLGDERSKSIVLSQEAQVRGFGVTGVPDFLINKRMFVIGPQRTEDLVNVFDRVMFGEESDLPVSPVVH